MPSLDETVALLEATLDATHDGIAVVSLDRIVVRVNAQFLRLFGFTREQVIGANADDVFRAIADQIEQFDDILDNSRQIFRGHSSEIIHLIRFRDGRVYHRSMAPQVVGGQRVGWVSTYRDLTEAPEETIELRQQRGFLEKAQQVARVGSWVAEHDGSSRLKWSAETYRIFAVPPGAFAGTIEAFQAFVHADDRDAVRRASEIARNGEGPYDIEHRIIRRDGVERWVHEKADVVRDGGGRVIRMIGTVQDITDRRELEEQLRQAQKLEAIGRLAGGVAHDLNNALTAIVGYTELALGALAADHAARPDVDEIRRAAERAESVTRQLLAFSRKQLLEPRVFSIQDSIAALQRMLERLLGATITLSATTAPNLPPIYGDPGQIQQALVNLAVNARDAMPDGGLLTLGATKVRISAAYARRHPPLVPGDYVEIAVADTGRGMSRETQRHIFEPFFTTKGVGKGTGLGLAMVYGTVKQSGGFIFVDSQEGRGTTFRLYLPPAAAQEARRPVAAGAPADAATILVVDDEPAVRTLVASALKSEGYRVLDAESGPDALRIAASAAGRIDVLLTDASMPGMSGVELATHLTRTRSGLKVLVMSGYSADPVTVEGLPVALLAKPFTPRDLKRKIGDVLGAVPR
jgi:two-component system cell cycle sensor histidine kinase/response regulator CckA